MEVVFFFFEGKRAKLADTSPRQSHVPRCRVSGHTNNRHNYTHTREENTRDLLQGPFRSLFHEPTASLQYLLLHRELVVFRKLLVVDHFAYLAYEAQE